MSYIPNLYGVVDANNSSTATLTGGSVFTGTATNVTNYSSIYVSAVTDQSSATNGLMVQFSSDGTNWDIQRAVTILVGNAGSATDCTCPFNVEARFFRVVYTNGSTAQGVFRLQTILNAQSSSQVGLAGQVYGSSKYKQPIMCSAAGALSVKLSEPISAFGDLRVIEPTPVSQFDFVYGNNNNYVTATGFTGATVSNSNQMATITTTTSSLSAGQLQSKKYFKYRDGLGGLVRFTSIFTTGIANNNQISGLGDTTDGYFFGYNGTSFGILYRRNSVDTWVTQTNWNQDNLLGINDVTNKSSMKLDPTKGNIYQISVSYLGFANIEFFIFNPDTSTFVLVHILSYANVNTVPLVTNPSLCLFWSAYNTAAAASTVTLSTASGGIFVDGQIVNLGAKYGRGNTKTNPGTSEINIISIRNNTTINGIANKSSLGIGIVTFSATDTTASNNANTCILNIWTNATVAGAPSFTNVDATNSIASYDTAGTTVTAGSGKLNGSFCCTFTSSTTVDLDKFEIYSYPGDILTFSVTLSASTANTKVVVTVNWVENT